MVSIRASADGLEVVDPVEGRRCRLGTDGAVDPVPVDGERFYFPVDAGVVLDVGSLAVEGVPATVVRRPDGTMVETLEPESRTELPADGYELELNAAVKLYVRTEGPLTAAVGDGRVEFSFDRGPVALGARSYHERPAGTITTPSDPEHVLRALSHLGSALKTTSCERSWPTLRGHPPTLELGGEFAVPESVERPDTGVRIVVPATLRAACVVAPLAFYLGADLVPGRDARLLVDGETFPLGTPDLETGVERTLKRAFFLDCLTRTEGLYPVALAEREAVEPTLDLEFGDLYGRPLAEQLAAYCSVPYERIEPHVPKWGLAAHVEPSPDGVEALPFVVGDLALVREVDPRPVPRSEVGSAVFDDFVAERTRGDGTAGDVPRIVRPRPVDAVEQAWFGSGVALGATKATTTAFRNDLDRTPGGGDIAITVVQNDPEMRREDDLVRSVYGSRADLPFDVTVRRGLGTEDLRAVLASDVDFLHYVGHVDDAGFRCVDGSLDAATLEEVGVGAFLLNACRSYRQGAALVAAGSVGGVVTFSDVIDGGAVRIGRTMARLLDLGFPLRASLDVARRESIVGGHYLVVGDGRVSVVQEEGGLSMLCEVDDVADGYRLTIHAYPPREGGMGTVARPTVEDDGRHFLAPGPIGPFELAADRLREYLSRHEYPVRTDGELYWRADSLDL